MSFVILDNVAFRAEDVRSIKRNSFDFTQIDMTDGSYYTTKKPLKEVVALVNAAERQPASEATP